MQTLLALSADTLPRVEDVRIDLRVTAFGLLLALATSLLFGILPALRAADGDLRSMRGGRTTTGGSGRLRNGLVVAQAALAMILIIGLREGMLRVVVGVGLGALASLGLTRALASQLHGVSAKDPLTFAVAPLILIAVALLACYLLARRATRVEAVTAPRAE